MNWSKPDFVEIILGMEATAYVNTDDKVAAHVPVAREEEEATSSLTTDH
jgi:coenzyme PQQ precursor peptide PqqA